MATHIGRREFVATIGAAAACPLVARAQQAAMPVVGYLSIGSPQFDTVRLAGFRQGLKEAGYVEGSNLLGDYRWADGQKDRLSALAGDLVSRPVSLIAAIGGPAPALAAKAATEAIPIVFVTAGDPVKLGVVASFNRPGGNVTGVSFMSAELGAKRLGLLHELLPGAARIAVLVDPNFPITEPFVSDVRVVAPAIRKQIEVLYASTVRDIDMVFASLAQKLVDALLVGPGPLDTNHRAQLVTLAAHHKVPAIYPSRESAQAGGLMSYGASLTDAYRQAGIYTGRILKGEKPANLPVIQSTKFEFVINISTAKALGLTFPPGLLAVADEVIE